MAEEIKNPNEKAEVKLKKGPYTWTGLEGSGEVNERTPVQEGVSSEDYLATETKKEAEQIGETIADKVFGLEEEPSEIRNIKLKLAQGELISSSEASVLREFEVFGNKKKEEVRELDEVLKENIEEIASAVPEIKKSVPPTAVSELAPLAPEFISPVPAETEVKTAEPPEEKKFARIIPAEEVAKIKVEETAKRAPVKIIPPAEVQEKPEIKEPAKIIPASEISKYNELIKDKEKALQKVQADREAKEARNLKEKEEWHREVESVQKPSADEKEGEILARLNHFYNKEPGEKAQIEEAKNELYKLRRKRYPEMSESKLRRAIETEIKALKKAETKDKLLKTEEAKEAEQKEVENLLGLEKIGKIEGFGQKFYDRYRDEHVWKDSSGKDIDDKEKRRELKNQTEIFLTALLKNFIKEDEAMLKKSVGYLMEKIISKS